jgi:hypothetical protein
MAGYDFDNSWEALTEPGRADRFFCHESLPPLPARGCECRLDTAWWLAELSRLIYVQEADEIGPAAGSHRRNDHLRAVEAEEVLFVNRQDLSAALVRLPAVDGAMQNVLVFRGTQNVRNWLSNINVLPASWPTGGLVHRGFLDALDRVWPALAPAVADAGPELLITGHSLGGALATLAAAQMAAAGAAPTALYTFGAPRVGDTAFGRVLDGVPVHRFVNGRDLVPLVPTPGPLVRFKHIGARRRLTHDGMRIVSGDIAGLRDWARRARQYFDGLSEHRWREAPPPLADHAPINYVARLDRLHRLA